MDFGDKVRGYIIAGSYEREDVKGGTILIRATKQEISFKKLEDRHSTFSRFCNLAATDPLVRMMLFQKTRFQFVPSYAYPLKVVYSVFLGKDDTFLNGGSLDEQNPVMKNLAERKEKADNLASESTSSALLRYVRLLFEDPSFRKSLVSGKPPRGDEADRLMSDFLKEHEDESLEMTADIIEFMRANVDLLEINPLFDALESVSDARHNHSILALVGPIWEKEEIIADAMAKIEGLREIRTSFASVCLECRFRNNLDSSIMLESNPRFPKVRTLCKKCSGTTILSQMELDIPRDMIQVFHEHHIQEFVLGYTIAQSSKIDKVYVHKNISLIANGNEQKSKEVDILAITKDKRTIAIEVTTTHRSAKIPEKASKKSSLLDALPIDLLFYISADPTMSEPETPSPNIVILGAKQIVNLVEQMEAHLSD